MEHAQMARQHVETGVFRMLMRTDGTGSVMECAFLRVHLVMELVWMEVCSVEKCAEEMMETGDLVMEDAFTKQKLVMEFVRWEVPYVVTVLGALLQVTGHSKSAMENAFHT